MPSPSSSLATLRPDLQDAMTEFDVAASQAGFIGLQVLPAIEVGRESGNFTRIPVEELLKYVADEPRAKAAGYTQSEYTFIQDQYATQEFGHVVPVFDAERAAYAEFLDHDIYAAAMARDVDLRRMERRIANLVFDATNWTGSALASSVPVEWSNPAAKPIDDVHAAKLRVWNGTGIWPNTLVINRLVFMNLRNNNQVLERIASWGAGSSIKAADVTVAQLAMVFDLKNVFVGGEPYNSANPAKTASISPMWSNEYAMVCRVANSGSFQEPCIGRTFAWTGDGAPVEGLLESYRDEGKRADMVRHRHNVGSKIFYKELGHLLANITA